MTKTSHNTIAILFAPILLCGCGIGFDHTLFMTKSNIGVDIDTKPPTAEISVARRELVIAPTFEGGLTPPVLAGFNTGNRALFGFDVSSVFAGGDAAWTLTQPGKEEDHTARLCLNATPPDKTYPIPSTGEIRPFVFGTDTTFGVKVAWSGMTAQFPDSLKIGFNRKEFALAPIFGQQNPNQSECPYSVEMPAFLATIEVGSESAVPQSIQSKYRQSFSTGRAANALAARDDEKEILLERLDRAFEKGSYDPDDNSRCIDKWLTEDKALKKERAQIINNWLAESGHKGQLPIFLSDNKYKENRAKFIKEKTIICP